MAIEITIPRLGWSMDEGTFHKWLRQSGQTTRPGDLLFVLEGDKAIQEIEAIDAGVLCIPTDAPRPGDTVQVGQVIGFLLAETEMSPGSVRPENRSASSTESPSSRPGASPQPATDSARKHSYGRRVATPRARARADDLGIDWRQLHGTGRGGRIRERDVMREIPEVNPE